MSLTPTERRIVHILLTRGPITGTAEVGLALWPERELSPQAAAFAVGGILRRLVNKRYVKASIEKGKTRYACTTLGDHAQEVDRLDKIDPRQLSLLEE
jgi:predicted transcriptional regulator